MSDKAWNSLAAAEVAADTPLSDEAKALLQPAMLAPAFAELLIGKGLLVDATRFVARAMTKFAAVKWAAECARDTMAPGVLPSVKAALAAVDSWLADPSDVNRRAAMAAAEAAGLGTPGGATALAVFFIGPSLAPPDVPAVPPADHLTAHAAASAIILAAVADPPTEADKRYRAFLSAGIEIAKQPPPAPVAAPAKPATPQPAPAPRPQPATAPPQPAPPPQPKMQPSPLTRDLL